MDEFDIKSRPQKEKGTYIVSKKWIRNYSIIECPLDVGVATRPRPGFSVNGDTFVIKKYNQFLLVGVIDGLGHGQFAHKASQTARNYIESHFEQSLTQ